MVIQESFTVEDYTEILKRFTTVQDELEEILYALEEEYKNDIIDDIDKEILISGYEDTQKLLNKVKEIIERG